MFIALWAGRRLEPGPLKASAARSHRELLVTFLWIEACYSLVIVSSLQGREARERPAGIMALRVLGHDNLYVSCKDMYHLLLLGHIIRRADWAQHVLPFLGWRMLQSNAVAADGSSTCAISQAGLLVCLDALPSNLGVVVAMAAGFSHACAVKASGELVCFGGNECGQCDVPPDLGPVMAVAAGW